MSLATLLWVFVVAVVPLLPTEPVVIACGAFAAAHGTSPVGTIVAAAAGSVVSDHLVYGFGRLAGGGLLRRLARRPSVAAILTRMGGILHRWGAVALIAGRWVPGGGTAAAVLAGSLSWPLRGFTPASLIGASAWSAYATLLGYLGGSVAHQPLLGIALSLVVALALSYVARRWFARRRPDSDPSPTETDADVP